MVQEHIKPQFMNITEDKLRGVCVYLHLSVKSHMCVGLQAVCVCVCVCVCPEIMCINLAFSYRNVGQRMDTSYLQDGALS